MARVLTILAFVIFGFAAPLAASPVILILGDSLTAGYGIEVQDSYPTILEKKLRASGFPKAVVVNAGTSGATSAFGPKTMRFQIKHRKPDLIVFALGSNDGLRGISVESTRKNILKVVDMAKGQKIPIVLAGLKVPPNYGPEYTKAFSQIFPQIAQEHQITYIPFLLQGVAGETKYNQEDGIHPNEAGHQIMAQTVFDKLKEIL